MDLAAPPAVVVVAAMAPAEAEAEAGAPAVALAAAGGSRVMGACFRLVRLWCGVMMMVVELVSRWLMLDRQGWGRVSIPASTQVTTHPPGTAPSAAPITAPPPPPPEPVVCVCVMIDGWSQMRVRCGRVDLNRSWYMDGGW